MSKEPLHENGDRSSGPTSVSGRLPEQRETSAASPPALDSTGAAGTQVRAARSIEGTMHAALGDAEPNHDLPPVDRPPRPDPPEPSPRAVSLQTLRRAGAFRWTGRAPAPLARQGKTLLGISGAARGGGFALRRHRYRANSAAAAIRHLPAFLPLALSCLRQMANAQRLPPSAPRPLHPLRLRPDWQRFGRVPGMRS